MVASAPFDSQAHDSYFVVGHLHYVLIGGVAFPIFAAAYYWLPSTRASCSTNGSARSTSG